MTALALKKSKIINTSLTYSILSIIAVILCCTSCNDEVSKNLQAKATALGKMNEIVVISDEDLWEGNLGDTLTYYFESAYPILPAPEPFFDLRHFTPLELQNEKLRRELRVYLVVANLGDTDSPTTEMIRRDLGESKYLEALENPNVNNSVGIDKWANNQLIIYLYAQNEEALASAIKRSFSAIAKRVNQHDKKQLYQRVYARHENEGLGVKIENEFGIRFKVPGEYVVALEKPEENLLWLRKDDNESTLNIVIQKMDYTDKEQISKAEIKRRRDEFGKGYVSSSEPGSYMVTNDRDLPMYDYTIDINGMYALETRGIWEINNDFLGGPFASYFILSKDQKTLYFIDTFVYAPGKDKRDLCQQLELIVKSIEG